MGKKSKTQKLTFSELQKQVQNKSIALNAKSAPLFKNSLGGALIDGVSYDQINYVSRLDGIKAAFAYPDIHPGKGIPVGACFISQEKFYPHLAGTDLGCGVLLCKLKIQSFRAEKMADFPWLEKQSKSSIFQLEKLAEKFKGPASRYGIFQKSISSLGGGNHFAEIAISYDSKTDLFKDNEFVLVIHTGSRLLGAQIGFDYCRKNQNQPLIAESEEALLWLEDQEFANQWAALNRYHCALNIAESIGCEMEVVCDVCHNGIEKLSLTELSHYLDPNIPDCFIHRKGAAKLSPLIPIPLNRNTGTVLMQGNMDLNNMVNNGFSSAHGAGRKWKRSECKERISENFSLKDLKRTKSGCFVSVSNIDSLWEEAPMAYKNTQETVNAIIQSKNAHPVCYFRPILNIKR